MKKLVKSSESLGLSASRPLKSGRHQGSIVYSAQGLSSKQRAKVARDSKDPKELKRLAYDNAESVRYEVLLNPNTPDSVVQELCKGFANSKNADVRENVAKRANDPELLARLAEDGDPYVRMAVADKTDDTELLAQFANDDDDRVRARVAERTDDPELLALLANDDSERVRMGLAERTDDPKILAQLANDDSERVRSRVAERNDHPELLAQLANDDSWWVRIRVAEQTTDPKILAQLANDDNWSVRVRVAEQTDDPELLAKLANDSDWPVRARVAEQTDDPDILAQLANDEEPAVRARVAEQTDDPTLLAQLADDEHSGVSRKAREKLNKSRSRSRKSTPKSDWSVPLYSISDYSQIEAEIDQVIEDALKQYGFKHLGSDSVTLNSPHGVYDNGGQLSVTFQTSDGDVSTDIDAEDILGPATSQNTKAKCVKTTLSWLENNLDV